MRFRKTLSQLCSLDDETRYGIFAYLRRSPRLMTAHEVADAIGISPRLARFHLEKLLDLGLLRATYSRPSGRAGPGAGRTSKLYEAVLEEVSASVPPRDYGFAASVLSEAIASSRPGEDPKRRALRLAKAKGRTLAQGKGDSSRQLRGMLEELGYEPQIDEEGTSFLLNCPFHQLAQRNPALICPINRAFIEGIASHTDIAVKLDPGPGRCCVVLEPNDS